MIPGVQEIKALALKYSKKQLANMAQTGLIDPQKAVMAGMMRDRIAKEDMQPPSTTVAQDVLGLGPQQQMAPQPQMGMQPPPQMAQAQPQMPPPQMGAPAQQPPVMAASGGVTSLPIEVQDYAGGGIVAFGDGGDVPGYAGEDGSVVRYQPGLFESGFQLPEGSFFGAFQRNALGFQESPAVRNATELQRIEQRLGEPNLSEAERQRLETGRRALIGLTSQTYPSEGMRGSATFANTLAPTNQSALPPPPPVPAAQNKRGARDGQGAAPSPRGTPIVDKSSTLEPPKLGDFNPNAIKLTGGKYDMPTIDKLEDITKEREKVEAAAGYNKNLTEEQLKRMEGKKGELADLKSRAGGEALMQFGLGLIGARRGQEFQAVGESGKAALGAYKSDIKELRSAKEKLEEREDALRIADNQAKKTNSAADIAKRDTQVAKYDAAKLEVYKAENDLAGKAAQVSANVYGTQEAAKTSVFNTLQAAQTAREQRQTQLQIAGMQAQTSREYTSALKAQGLQDSQIKNIMGTASEIYKAALAKNPTADEAAVWSTALRQASQGYAQVAPMVGKSMPGALPPPAPAPTAEFYKNTFGITPTR
jgi:hypothetical protein